MRSDGGANKDLYGKELSAKEIVREGKVQTPASGKPLIQPLQRRRLSTRLKTQSPGEGVISHISTG